jgi:DNA-directed RNA polymerase specialized sigma24 family protein
VSAAELVERCGTHDCSESWREFLRRYGQALAGSVRRALAARGYTWARELDEDIRQEVFCRLLANGRRRLLNCRGSDDREVVGYLCRIAENVVADHVRRANAVKRGRRLRVAYPPAERSGLVDRAADPAACVERKALMRESRRLFFDRAGRILRGPNRRRDLWVTYLAIFEGWSSREISKRLGVITTNNVDSVVYRTRMRLAAGGIELRDLGARRRSRT